MTESTLKDPKLRPALEALKDAVETCKRPSAPQAAAGLIKYAVYQAMDAKAALEAAAPVDPADKALFAEVTRQLREAYDALRARVVQHLESKG